ncbi:MAG: CYTH domain-containing protein [Alphaproteobacteria bacterium]|nr:CYTH domain-containing protein [Alphaproteobacteria bacterium]
MQQIIECEEKFFCAHTPALFHFIEKELKFKFQKKVFETDIYLKDKQSLYIQKDSCLRIRKSNLPFFELTSKKLLKNDIRVKIEKTITFPAHKHQRILALLKRIGFKEYCTVFKERFIYTSDKFSSTYNIMLDVINKKTSFLELEIVSEKNDPQLLKKLSEFEKLFQKFNLQKTDQNYRDFVKNHHL